MLRKSYNGNPLNSIIRDGDVEGEIIIDTENLLEQFLSGLGVCGILAAIAGGLIFGLELLSTQPLFSGSDHLPIKMVVGGVAVGVLGIYLRSLVDFYYILDLNNRVIKYHSRYLNNHSRREICEFSDVHSLVVDSKKTRRSKKVGKRTRYYDEWHYGLVMISNQGKVTRFMSRDVSGRENVRQKGRLLAESLGVELHSEPEKVFRLKMGEQGPEIDWTDRTRFEELATAGCLTLLVLFLGQLAYLMIKSL